MKIRFLGLFFRIFAKSAADKTGCRGDQVLQRHFLSVLEPLPVEDSSDWREVGKDKIILVDVSAERASVAICLIRHDLFVDTVPDMFIASA